MLVIGRLLDKREVGKLREAREREREREKVRECV